MASDTTKTMVRELYEGVWGPVTATLDWCEANYQFSPYIAEMANSISNLATVAFALLGAQTIRQERFPPRYLVGVLGLALVGLGSFAFHATLLYEAQLADELPMIYTASYACYVLFDTVPGFELEYPRSYRLVGAKVAFDVLFTWSYYVYRNPVYHQVVFASLLFTTVFRTNFLLRAHAHRIPPDVRSSIVWMFTSGAFWFAFGFLIWNLDNIYCGTLTTWKQAIGWPAAFFLEGHSWWHFFTGLGTYLMLMAVTYQTLCVKDDYRNYRVVRSFGLPHVVRNRGSKAEKDAKTQ